MQLENSTIILTVPTGWDKLDDHQLRYVFGLLAQGFPSPQVKTYCLFRWTGMQVMHKYGKGWWCKFADDEFVIMAEQVNSAIAGKASLESFILLLIRENICISLAANDIIIIYLCQNTIEL